MTDRHKPSRQVRLPLEYFNKLLKMARNNQPVSGVIMDLVDNYKPRNSNGRFINKGR